MSLGAFENWIGEKNCEDCKKKYKATRTSLRCPVCRELKKKERSKKSYESKK